MTKIHTLSFIALLLILTYSPVKAQVLVDVSYKIQAQSEWCWAASSQCLLSYYGYSVSQCDIAEYARGNNLRYNYGNVNCCTDPTQGCNNINDLFDISFLNAGTVSDILNHFGYLSSSRYNRALTLSEVQTQISAQNPFAFAIKWSIGTQQGGHVMVGYGLIGNYVFYMDPEPINNSFDGGPHIGDINWLTNGPPGEELQTHSWEETLIITGNNHNFVCTDAYEPNNSGIAATQVFQTPLTGSADYTMHANIGYSGDEDWYRIDLNTPGNLQINVTNLPNIYDLKLFSDAAGTNLLQGALNPLNYTLMVNYDNTSSGLTSVYAKVYADNHTAYWTGSCYDIEFVYTPTSITGCALTGVTPNLVSPGVSNSPGAIINTLTPMLSWSAVSGAASYGVYVRDITSGSLVVNQDCATSGTTFQIPTSVLSNNGHYRWNIIANGSCGGSCLSNYAPALYFNVQTYTCSLNGIAPTLTSPGTSIYPGQSLTTTTPTLNWNSVAGATNYGVYIRDMNSGQLVLNNDCATSSTAYTVLPNVLVNGGQYRWNMIATTSCGSNCTSNYPSGVYFQIQNSTCTAPTAQAANILFSGVTGNSMDVSWTSGNGSKRIVKISTTNH
jgi:hypothetical protein